MGKTVPSLPETLAAVEVLSRAGVSDEVVGRAVREWLERVHTNTASLYVGSTPAPVQTARAEPSTLNPVAPEPCEMGERNFVPLKIRFQDGSATNIALPGALLKNVAERYGGEQVARRMARDLAKRAPPDVKNRSGWVTAELTKELAKPGNANG